MASGVQIVARSEPGEQQTRLPYLPVLDSLRALAIIPVLLYHTGMNWLPGGFLGVEVFFVISGYLITSLLLAEWQQHKGINLPAFWLRRARRLLPGLFLLLVTTLATAVLFLPDEIARLRGDAFAAAGYVSNWYLILHQVSYFETVGRPSLLQHLWSLAVEEQFYLLWPLLLALVLRRGRVLTVLAIALLGAAASIALMWILYHPGADPSRVYYGTDTRAAGLLIGAALACVWMPGQVQSSTGPTDGVFADVIALLALGELAWCFRFLNPYQSTLYHGGFGLVSYVTAMLIAALVHPYARLAPYLLKRRVLCWIGQRSYSLYLWHWPVFMVTRPRLDLPLDGLPLLVLRLAMTLVISELSYRCVEMPIRTGGLERLWHEFRASCRQQRWWLDVRWVGTTGIITALCLALSIAVVRAQPPAPPSYLSVTSVHMTNATPVLPSPIEAPSPALPPPIEASPVLIPIIPATGTPAAFNTFLQHAAPFTSTLEVDVDTAALIFTKTLSASAALASAEKHFPGTPSPTPSPTVEPSPIPTEPPPPPRITAIGDSVMLGAAADLVNTIPNIEVDAAVSRQVDTAIAILQAHRDAGTLGDIVIVHMGNNGSFTSEQVDIIMQTLTGVPRVLMVNLLVPRLWQDVNNAAIVDGVQRYPNTVLVDWHAAGMDHPEFFWGDGYHLRPEGAQAYTQLIVAHLAAP